MPVLDGGAMIVAGGTDIYPAHVGRPLPASVVDISRIAELQGISATATGLRIGAAVTWSELLAAQLPSAFDALKQAAREVGSRQIQNRGTVAGNLCNASPAADGVPPLLSLDAQVELVSPRGLRQMPLERFITGYRRTALTPGELLTAVLIPNCSIAGTSAFEKLGARRYLVISIIMAAARIEFADGGRIGNARIAVGAASPVAVRLPSLEDDLRGLAPGVRPSSLLADRHLEPLKPISDLRAAATYRRDAARTVIGRALDRACGMVPA